jgi:hypothetical protein
MRLHYILKPDYQGKDETDAGLGLIDYENAHYNGHLFEIEAHLAN